MVLLDFGHWQIVQVFKNLMSDRDFSETRIDNVCEEFESQWQRGSSAPQLSDFIGEENEKLGVRLLEELLKLDVCYRKQNGQIVATGDYKKFGADAVEIANAILCDLEDVTQAPKAKPPADDSADQKKEESSPRIGRYKLINKIGEGGMGEVWLAERNNPYQQVAVKLIQLDLSLSASLRKELIARFEAEREALAMMDHTNIAKILDGGTTEDGQPFFVMELVRGTTLNKYCDSRKLGINARLKIFADICKAVQHAHQKGIIHRDLKPGNIVVSEVDDEPVPKVIDFGLAKALKQHTKLTDKTLHTQVGQALGTWQYMSPEQAGSDGLDVDTRTDIFSLGAILHQLLVGSPPINREEMLKRVSNLAPQLHDYEFAAMIRDFEPKRPSEKLSNWSKSGSGNTKGETKNDLLNSVSGNRSIDSSKLQFLLRGELDWIVLKAIARERSRRYESASELAREIQRYMSGEAVQARPPSVSYRARKFVRKNRGLVASLATIAAMLVATVAFSSYYAVQADIAKNDAVKQKTAAEDQKEIADKKTEEAKRERAVASNESARFKLQLAKAYWDNNRVLEARDTLSQIPDEYRNNFEWQFFNRHFLGSDLTFYGHISSVSSAVFTHDGSKVISGSNDGTIRVWNAKTGQELRSFNGFQPSGVSAIAINKDGTRIASGNLSDKPTRLWDLNTGNEIRKFEGSLGDKTLAFSPNGKLLATGGSKQLIIVRDVQNGQVYKTLKHNGTVSSVEFSHDGKHIAAVSFHKSLKLWDVQTGKELFSTADILGGSCAAFSPDGSRLATAYDDKTIRILDAKTGEEIQTLRGHEANSVLAIAFSPDGSRLAAGCSDTNNIKIWDLSTSQAITLKGHTSFVRSLAFSPNGTRLISVSRDNTLKLWDCKSGVEAIELRGHSKMSSKLSERATRVIFSPDGSQLASGVGTQLKLWDVEKGMELNSFGPIMFNGGYSPDGRLIASGRSNSIVIWNAKTGQPSQQFDGHSATVNHVTFSPDGSMLASASSDQKVKIWNIQSGEEIRTLEGHTGSVKSVAFSPDSSRLVSGGSRETKIWKLNSGEEEFTFDFNSKNVSFTPNGKQIISLDTKLVKVWDAATGKELNRFKRQANWCAISPDGTRVAGSSKNSISLLNLKTGQETTIEDPGIWSIAFSPDGMRLATVNHLNSVIRIWSTTSGQETIPLKRHLHHVNFVGFANEGREIYSRSIPEKIVWDTSQRKPTDGKWGPLNNWIQKSPDGKWLLTSEDTNVLMVDLAFKNRPAEKLRQEIKNRFDPWWHKEQAESAINNRNWYAGAFHYSWLLESSPDQTELYDRLHFCSERLAEQFEKESRELQPHLSRVVQTALEIPRGELRSQLHPQQVEGLNKSLWQRVATKTAFERVSISCLDLLKFRDMTAQYPKGIYYNTLGTTEYRFGNYALAIQAAEKSLELTPEEISLPAPHPIDYAIIAMSHFQLGEKDLAFEFQKKLIESVKQDFFRNDSECLSFLAEVEELLESRR